MNKIFIILTLVIMAVLIPLTVFACTPGVCPGEDPIGKPLGCSSGYPKCFSSGFSVYDCRRCADGFTHKVEWVSVPGCSDIEIGTCVPGCTGCSNCVSDAWSAHTVAGYQKRTLRSCNCNTCRISGIDYQCAPQYYGVSSSGGTSGCNPCPSGGKSAAGTTSITGCYLPTGNAGSDGGGKFEYTNNCYYSN